MIRRPVRGQFPSGGRKDQLRGRPPAMLFANRVDFGGTGFQRAQQNCIWIGNRSRLDGR
jgi:hypothetical protein